MRPASVVAILLLAACGGMVEPASPAKPPPPVDATPGSSIDLASLFEGALINAPPGGTVTWEIASAVPQAAYDSGLALSSTGLLTLPDCRFSAQYGFTWPLSIGLQAHAGTATLLSIAVVVDERYLSTAVSCFIVSTETTCRDPNVGGIVFEAGQTVQLYWRTRTTCGSNWTPALPAGACPATDPAYTFCQ